MKDIIVVDNFLHKMTQREIEFKTIDDCPFSYGYSHSFVFRSDEKYMDRLSARKDENIIDTDCGMFFHEIIREEEKKSKHFDKEIEIFPDYIDKKFGIKVNKIIRMRVNFMTPLGLDPMKYTSPHKDNDNDDCKIFIYYINDSDGDTVIFDEFYQDNHCYEKKTISKRISPKKGRACIFAANRYHAASFPSKKVRVLINMNFI